ncbi:MAG: OsmC family protein [Ignavibacteriales bacterium]|nr:OsmC family protein [Ignavibacteriales bacterium]
MVPQSIRYLGELRCKATHSPSSVELITDAPTDNHGKGESFSPTDLVVTALATCIITTTGIVAEREGIALAGTKIYAEKHMSTDGPRRIAKIVLRFDVSPGVPNEVRKKLEATAHACPVARSLHPDVVIDLAFRYPD